MTTFWLLLALLDFILAAFIGIMYYMACREEKRKEDFCNNCKLKEEIRWK